MAAIDPNTARENIKEHMKVIAADGETIGKVDHLQGGRIKLTKNDSPDGQHHFVPLRWVEGIDVHVHLNVTLAEIREETRGVEATDAVPEVGRHDAVPGKI